MIPDLTLAAGAPRVVGIEFPFGRPVGQPHDTNTQGEVLWATLQVLRDAKPSGTVSHLSFEWSEPVDEVHWHPQERSPIMKLLTRDPSLFKRLVDGDTLPEASRRDQ